MAGSVFSYQVQGGQRRWGFVIDQGQVREGKRLKRQQLRRQGFARRLDAERALEVELPAIRAETAPTLAARQTTLSEYLDTWLAIARKKDGKAWRPSTVATYRSSVECYLRPGLGHLRLTEIRRQHVELLAQHMRDGTLRPGQAPLSRRTIHQARATLRACLTQAVKDGTITTNPAGEAAGARVPGPGPSEPKFWTPEQLAAFLAHAEEREPRLAVAYQLAGWRGLRRGELCGLKWGDIDLDGGELHVVRNVTETDGPCLDGCAADCPGGPVHVGETKTKKGKRTVSVGPKLAAALRAHRRAQPVRRIGEDWVFPAPDGRVLTPHVLTHRFKALVRELPELPQLHLHSLRHTAATMMLLAGVAPKVVQDQLGHATLAMTMDTYAQVLPQQRDASADAVEALFSAPM